MAVLITVIAVAILLLVLALSLKIVTEYQRGVLFRLGRVIGTREPGLHVIVPAIDRLHKVSLRIVTQPIQSQGIITRDNVSVDIAAVAYYRVIDAVKSIVAIENVSAAIDQGVEVTLVELKDIQLPEDMKRAMAKEAEAEREKRAKIIAAEGEAMAAASLGQASDIMMEHPLALQLRNLQTLIEIAVDKNSTVVFPASLMSTISELGSFLSHESMASDRLRTEVLVDGDRQ